MKINDLFFNLNLTCNACGKENDNGYFCEKCKKELPFNNVICDKCGRSTINKESRCISCDDRELHFEKARSVFKYLLPINVMIKRLKYRHKKYLAKVFSPVMAQILLTEFKDTDYIINITDASEEITERERKRKVTYDLIQELGAGDKPIIEVFNKCDIALRDTPFPKGTIEISARSGDGTQSLLEKLDELVASGKKKLRLLIPYSEGSVVADIHRLATVLECDYVDNGTLILAECDARAQGTFEKYIAE